MKLPDRTKSQPLELPDDIRQVAVIGANGAGKTRFTRALIEKHREAGRPVFRLSVLRAIYGDPAGETETSQADTVGAIFAEAENRPAFMHLRSRRGELDELIALLLNEEIASLMDFKTSRHTSGDQLPETKIDRVLELWRTVFPENNASANGGSLEFTRTGSHDRYQHLRLSDGEKAVLYYLGGVLYAPEKAMVFVDTPELFLHTSSVTRVWDIIEALRPDCRFVYTTHDPDFASSRSNAAVIWVKSFDAEARTWDYDLLPQNSSGALPEGVYMAILGSRRPVLFIEGDAIHSIDSRLYPLVFPEYMVRPLGSCNKVIEAVRTFNDLTSFHHLDSRGIVDRDRRDDREVAYLRRKNIYVPDVAEVENLLLLEGVVKAVASYHGKSPERVFNSVRRSILGQFNKDLRRQALLHTRHRVKMTMSYRIDGRFNSISDLERHITQLTMELSPRKIYEDFCRQFKRYLQIGDYPAILRVYNQKSMLPGCNVAGLCGLPQGRNPYVDAVIAILRTKSPQAKEIRSTIAEAFHQELPDVPDEPAAEPED